MTTEEALNLFRDHEYWADISLIDEACEIAIEAIEKQIPKKEIKKTATYDGEQHDYGVCPICFVQGRFAGTMTANYCYNCGQAIIDWSEKE